MRSRSCSVSRRRTATMAPRPSPTAATWRASWRKRRAPLTARRGPAASRPEAAAGADGHRQQAEHEIDGDDAADLIELFGYVLERAGLDRAGKPSPRREIEMQEQQRHDDAGELHDIDVRPRPGEPAEVNEQHRVTAD